MSFCSLSSVSRYPYTLSVGAAVQRRVSVALEKYQVVQRQRGEIPRDGAYRVTAGAIVCIDVVQQAREQTAGATRATAARGPKSTVYLTASCNRTPFIPSPHTNFGVSKSCSTVKLVANLPSRTGDDFLGDTSAVYLLQYILCQFAPCWYNIAQAVRQKPIARCGTTSVIIRGALSSDLRHRIGHALAGPSDNKEKETEKVHSL